MARNRKYYSAAVRFGPALRALLLCLVIGGSGVGYVWQKDQISRLANQMKQREQRLAVLAELNDKLNQQLARLRAPAALEAKIKDLKLGLVQPQLSQIWRLPEPSRDAPKNTRDGQLAAHDSSTAIMP